MKKKSLSFSTELFLSVMSLYTIFALGFLYYQYHREKVHKVEILDNTLTMFNISLHEHLHDSAFSVPAYIPQTID